ncbi:hypothetical protein CAL16_02335 [Klebsiella quasipneumoniae]|nr:hypothetical protein CAL16_02335 [Klebsiella quasipneumoniae]OWK83737.1 hypothetical protein CAK92_08815 [Klebsiella quasipneumoniae]PLJ32123.1 hypothetical protein B6J62_08065 [Klebsiella quasipneumoniae]RWT65891.1 hypothetical protein DN601_01040 [Klebsiella quasipneumoniae subsp. similipneumoniae]
MPRPAAQWSALTSISIPSPAPPSPPCSVNLPPDSGCRLIRATCWDKSKAPRSGDVAGRSPGVQGAAATGRPLCAPCTMRNIT